MILLDTSVLIGYFKNQTTQATTLLDGALHHDFPIGICDFVYQEVLQGSRTEVEFTRLKEYLGSLQFYGLLYGMESYERAAALYRLCRVQGITVRSTIDVLIAEIAIENGLYLLHDDHDFDLLSSVEPQLKIWKSTGGADVV